MNAKSIEETLVKLELNNEKILDLALKSKDDKLFNDWKEMNMVIAEGWSILAQHAHDQLIENAETELGKEYGDYMEAKC